MPEIAFLLGDTRIARNDNHLRLPAAFEAAGWAVTAVPQEAVRLAPNGVRFGATDPARFDLIWLLGLGRAETFFDRMQLLRQLPQNRFVTRIDALVYLHAKYGWWRYMPETYASNDAGYLKSLLDQGGEWIAKPSAGSYGRDVERLRADPAGAAAIDRLTGNGAELYCLLQRFVPEIAAGEKRTLVAGGRIIGSYLRMPEAGFRSNLAQGASAQPASLEPGERRLVESVARELVSEGIGYAAVDTVFPFLMEVNLANPGGLGTLAELGGGDVAGDVVAAVVAALSAVSGG
ncbi:MAG: ATP-grasp domain-containing protein [Pseudomonadales bacterium]